MNIDLVLAAGLAYTVLGALVLYLSHRAVHRNATRIVAGYPRVLAVLRAQRHDAGFGAIVLACGNVLQVLAAFGYTVPLAYWRIPVYVALATFFLYAAWRMLAVRRSARAQSAAALREPVGRVFETRRSIALLEAARRDAASRQGREVAREPSNRYVVYVGEDWECRWWSERLGVSCDALRAAVRETGPMLKDVERHLALRRQRAAYALAA